MKAIRLRDAKCRNPAYDRRKSARRVLEGGEPIPHTLECKAGEEVDTPDAWKLCLGADPLLAPADDECRAAVLKVLNSPGRKAELENLKLMYDKRDQLGADDRKYVEAIFSKHAAEIQGKTPAQKTPAQAPPEALDSGK